MHRLPPADVPLREPGSSHAGESSDLPSACVQQTGCRNRLTLKPSGLELGGQVDELCFKLGRRSSQKSEASSSDFVRGTFVPEACGV